MRKLRNVLYWALLAIMTIFMAFLCVGLYQISKESDTCGKIFAACMGVALVYGFFTRIVADPDPNYD